MLYNNLDRKGGEGNGTPLQYPCLENPMEEPGRLQSMGSLRVGHNWATSLSLFTFTHWRRKWQPTPVFLPGESQGPGSLVGCCLWGRRVGYDWSDSAAADRKGVWGENGYVYMYGSVPLLFSWNYHNIVNWLYPKYKIKNVECKNLWNASILGHICVWNVKQKMYMIQNNVQKFISVVKCKHIFIKEGGVLSWLKYNLHTIKFTHLKYTIQWFCIFRIVQPSPLSNYKTFLSLQKEIPYPLAATPFPTCSPNLWPPPVCFLTMDLSILDFPYIWNYVVYVLFSSV